MCTLIMPSRRMALYLNMCVMGSVHEREALFELLGALGVDFLLQVELLGLVPVLLKGRVDEDPAGSHGRDGPPQVVDLQEVHCPVERVQLLVVELPEAGRQCLSEGVCQHVVLELRRLLDFVVELLEDAQHLLEGLLVDVGDADLSA